MAALPPPTRVKLVVFIPASHVEAAVAALHRAGAGRIGSYDHCVTIVPVTAQWRPLPGARPWRGTVGELESAEEVRLETSCPAERLPTVLEAVRAVHPYEEPVIDVMPLLDTPVAAATPAEPPADGSELWPAGTACTLVTLDAAGRPFAVPVSAARARRDDPARVVFALALRRGSLARLRDDGRAALTVMARDVALTVRGRVQVVEEGPPEAPRVALLELLVEATDDHRHPDTVLEGPVAWSWRTAAAAARDADVHRALRRLLGGPPAH